MSNRKKQEKYKRWYDKHLWGVFKRNCSVCGTEFYTVNSNQLVCDQEKCRTKWKNVMQEEKHI